MTVGDEPTDGCEPTGVQVDGFFMGNAYQSFTGFIPNLGGSQEGTSSPVQNTATGLIGEPVPLCTSMIHDQDRRSARRNVLEAFDLVRIEM